MTTRLTKGMLTGPVTILNWSFVRNASPGNLYILTELVWFMQSSYHFNALFTFILCASFRFETCYQIALAIKDKVEDLEKANINIVQIDKAALREGETLLSVFWEGVKYGAGISPGVGDVHPPRFLSMGEIVDRIAKVLTVLDPNVLWVNPDCGLKTPLSTMKSSRPLATWLQLSRRFECIWPVPRELSKLETDLRSLI
ncbi:hypothetical protein Nepgr_000216 [Nepenthes gracilis]|uniref:Cobalamin-independent methionine synthase MetE C-terminal/archaeal domain-containing protein n=1 Tax=Nepenthes gracilis TaxID=150966 RepID=A0AAD3P3I2_NEPGR|nr:hypothetical protein Nepgr_000216 [Nepenthes gracilis]